MKTPTDKLVLKYIEEFDSLTLKQCQRGFYNTQNCGYEVARRRMQKLVDAKYLKVGKNKTSNENVYYMERKLKQHDLLVMDFYIELLAMGATDITFIRSKPWLDNLIISDAYAIYTFGGFTYYNIVEVCLTHNRIPMDNYEKLFDSHEGDIINPGEENSFPSIIIIDDVSHKKEMNSSSRIKIYKINFELSDFAKIFID